MMTWINSYGPYVPKLPGDDGLGMLRVVNQFTLGRKITHIICTNHVVKEDYMGLPLPVGGNVAYYAVYTPNVEGGKSYDMYYPPGTRTVILLSETDLDRPSIGNGTYFGIISLDDVVKGTEKIMGGWKVRYDNAQVTLYAHPKDLAGSFSEASPAIKSVMQYVHENKHKFGFTSL